MRQCCNKLSFKLETFERTKSLIWVKALVRMAIGRFSSPISRCEKNLSFGIPQVNQLLLSTNMAECWCTHTYWYQISCAYVHTQKYRLGLGKPMHGGKFINIVELVIFAMYICVFICRTALEEETTKSIHGSILNTRSPQRPRVQNSCLALPIIQMAKWHLLPCIVFTSWLAWTSRRLNRTMASLHLRNSLVHHVEAIVLTNWRGDIGDPYPVMIRENRFGTLSLSGSVFVVSWFDWPRLIISWWNSKGRNLRVCFG